ncbi:hypothetical protein L1049_009749 [Liquidambar formosana]|uniref:F-box domain-containing protein n=1 Tax=Liquidambar formosana TaxID=63359 RepID=A0AAP0N6C4_LIQFO
MVTTSFLSDLIASISAIVVISANLPSEIITEIFSRLPVKSLMRFKCVSKSMYALVISHSFIKKHLRQAVLQNNPCLILKLETHFSPKLFSVENDEWKLAKRLDLSFANVLEKIEPSGSSNGLVCISDHIRNEDIFLWNPSTRQQIKLPYPRFKIPTIETSCFTALGFGYLPAEDDYKVVRVVYLYDKPFVNIDSYQCEAQVFSLSTNSWRKVRDVPFHISSRSSVSLENGTLVWKASRGFGLRMTVLVISFDLVTGEFEEIPQPDLDDDSYFELGVLGGYLCIFDQLRNERAEVWSMQEFGVKASWKKLFVIGPPPINDGYFGTLKPLWVMKSREILIEKGGREMVLYDPENGEFRDVRIRGCPRNFAASTCVGSLVPPFAFINETAGASTSQGNM